MHKLNEVLRAKSIELNSIRFIAAAFGTLLTATASALHGQTPPSQPAAAPPAAASPIQAAQASSTTTNAPTTTGGSRDAVTATPLRAGAFSVQTADGELKEDQLKQLLFGKSLYLRGGYLDNDLEFDEWGRLSGHSPQGSFTLNEIQIDKVKLTNHKLELEGERYALHFPGTAPYEDPMSATFKVKITPRKKIVRISFDRERVEVPKKKKHDAGPSREQHPANTAGASSPTGDPAIAAAIVTPIDPATSDGKVTTTTSPAHASQLLLSAMDKVFSFGIDDRMVQSMPDFWKLYFQAVLNRQDYKPNDPGIYRQNTVDRKAKLISKLDPPSNEFAQANEIAGMALYHAVIGSDGRVEKVVVARPIGFGLDENAEQTIEKAVFQPAEKDGKAVPVALDLIVSFRIYSERTSQPATQETAGNRGPLLPGPYTVQDHAQTAQQPQQAQPSQPSQSPQ
jgi:hypothetical protein